MSDPLATAVGAVPAILKPAGGPAHVELYIHGLIALAAICAMTVLGALKVVDGSTIAGLIAAIVGVNGTVTGLHTFSNGNSR